MASLIEIMQLCRLCLVKDQVNIPIFEEQGDVRQIFLKLAACFPTVQVSRDDNLPKKICESCMFKLEHSYQFWSLTTNAEKQLNVWLKQIGLDANSKVVGQQSLQMVAQSHAHPHSLETETVILKQEAIDPIDVRPDIGVSSDTQSYILQQQQLPYQPVGFQYEQPPAFSQPSTSSNTGPSATVTSATNEPAMLGKRKRRQVITNPIPSSEESDDDEDIQPPKIAKEEEDSDSADDNEPLQPTAFVSVPAISQDAEQPGPSGLNKPTAGSTSEAPFRNYELLSHLEPIVTISEYPADCVTKKTPVNKVSATKSQQKRKKGRPRKQVNNLFVGLTNDEESEVVVKDEETDIIIKDEMKTERDTSLLGKIDLQKVLFKCNLCELTFSSYDDFCHHFTTGHECVNTENPVCCVICNENYSDSAEFLTHLDTHRNSFPLKYHQCEFCKQQFKSLKHYQSHLKKHRNETLDCTQCTAQFTSPKRFDYHMKLHENGHRMFRCDLCKKDFASKQNLQQHAELHNKPNTNPNLFTCDKCKLRYSRLMELAMHIRIHSEDPRLKCPSCDYVTDNVTFLNNHISDTHEPKYKYKCEICGKGFFQGSWYEEHKNFHTGDKPFQCEFCGKKFPYSRYLTAHKMSMHKEALTGVPVINECNICNKRYAHKNSLLLHMSTHTGENVAICDVCGKQLSSKEKLKFHMRIHTGYKPYSCRFCEKAFSKKTTLIEHERVHTGEKPYSCDYCDKAFSQRSSMVIHKRTHTGERPYTCHLCNKGFVARAMLNIHIKSCNGLD